MGRVGNIMKRWLPLAVVITAVCGLVYLAVQQELRHYADDPQIQLAEDAAYAIENGASIESRVPEGGIAIERSGAPFITVFDDRGAVVRSSGLLHGRPRELPVGVLEYVRKHGEDRITWQPERGVRIAAIIVRYGGERPGFVLAGRSLREIEKRKSAVAAVAGIAWILTMTASLVVAVLAEMLIPGTRAT